MTNKEKLMEFLNSLLASKLHDSQSFNFSTTAFTISDAVSESKALSKKCKKF
jgi:hypothetical protein